MIYMIHSAHIIACTMDKANHANVKDAPKKAGISPASKVQLNCFSLSQTV